MPIRLIDVKTLRMSVFSNEASTPQYAILSHTWVEGQEADFQNMMQVMGSDKILSSEAWSNHPGLNKIKRACETVASSGHDYIWIDTCCINKSDLTELSESINSMFKWYKRARVCYAYLADLEAGADLYTQLRGCRWFTRGWCLQELVAPKDLIFLDQTWTIVGTKSMFESLVATITSIPVHVLRPAKDISEVLAETVIATKMSWAADRTTTRAEDLAYCLLGIFDVNMPLLYGEGSKAFLRLQQEIIKQSNDLSIFFSWDSPDERAKTRNCQGSHDGHSPYRSLLARTPADFRPTTLGKCANIERTTLRGLDAQHSSFTMENAGLFIRDAIMEVIELESGGACYGLKIGHMRERESDHSLDNTNIYLFLEKVGPGRFARLSYEFLGRYGGYEPRAPGGYLGSEMSMDTTEAILPRPRNFGLASFEGDSYVITDYVPSLDFRPIRAVIFAFEFAGSRLSPSEMNWTQLIDAEPRGRFDASTLSFLRPKPYQTPHFHLLGYAHIQLSPPRRSILQQVRRCSFYAVCAFWPRYHVGVKLFSPELWESVSLKYATAILEYKRFQTISYEICSDMQTQDVLSFRHGQGTVQIRAELLPKHKSLGDPNLTPYELNIKVDYLSDQEADNGSSDRT
ncbi:hypothetical protein RB595_010222 [Gaeumannomyces hyphopodioides]